MALAGSIESSEPGPEHTQPSSSSSPIAPEAARKRKEPPPETPANVRLRRWVIFSFWAVAAFLGLPMWWRTTAIYRAELPLQAMSDWAEGKVLDCFFTTRSPTPLTSCQICKPAFPLRISVQVPLAAHDAYHLIHTTQHALDDLDTFSAHQLRLILADPPQTANASQQVTVDGTSNASDDQDVALSIRLIPVQTGETPRAHLQRYTPTLDVYYLPSQIPTSSAAPSSLANFIANELHNIFAEEQAQLVHLLSTTPDKHVSDGSSMSSETAAELQRRSARALKYAPTYHLTFSLFTPNASPSAWHIETALKQYLSPFLETFSSISNFTVDTQVQLYATFSPSIRQPEFDEELKAWTLRTEDLSGFVNAAEWPLSPSIGEGPTVNFALYAPDRSQSPLLIKPGGASSWLVPQWGGVAILNPTSHSNNEPWSNVLTSEDLAPAMRIFSNQLVSLLGLPERPHSFPLRLSTLKRVRTASLILSASSTLGALAQVYRKLPSIPVPDSVAKFADLALSHLHHTCNEVHNGQFQNALEHARIADGAAEKAFFERSMVGQVYFPDEHKVAVYLPLLGPVAVPLVMAALKEIKSAMAAWKGR